MKLFIPAIKHRIKLINDWKFNLSYDYINDNLLSSVLSSSEFEAISNNRLPRFEKVVETTLVANTILEVNRIDIKTHFKVNSHHYDSITFKIIGKGKKGILFNVRLTDVNNIEYELPDDFEISKISADARLKAPKAFSNSDIGNEIQGAIHDHQMGIHGCKLSKWLDHETMEMFKSLHEEYKALQGSVDEEISILQQRYEERMLKEQFDKGEASIPIMHKDTIKTFDDYKKIYANGKYAKPPVHYINLYTLEHYVNYGIMKYSNEKRKKCANGNFVRRFQHPAPLEHYQKWHEFGAIPPNPDLSHQYIDVFTNSDDTEIICVKGGNIKTL